MNQKLPERRRFVRLSVPLRVVVASGNGSFEVVTKNISPVGLRFESKKELKKSGALGLTLYLPSQDTPIQLKAKLIWQSKTSLEDNASYDVGVEILHIDDKNKNAFLKYLCELFYNSTYQIRT